MKPEENSQVPVSEKLQELPMTSDEYYALAIEDERTREKEISRSVIGSGVNFDMYKKSRQGEEIPSENTDETPAETISPSGDAVESGADESLPLSDEKPDYGGAQKRKDAIIQHSKDWDAALDDDELTWEDYASDAGMQAIAGASDAAENALELMFVDMPVSLGIRPPRLDINGKPMLKTFEFTPNIGPPKTIAGEIAKPLATFTAGFIPALRLAKWAMGGMKLAATHPWVHGAAMSSAAGGLTGFAAVDPNQERFNETMKNYSWLEPIANEWIAGDEDDSVLEKRLKNGVEEMALSVVGDTVFRSGGAAYRMIRGRRISNDAAKKNVVSDLTKDQQTQVKVAADELVSLRSMVEDVESIVKELAVDRSADAPLNEALDFLRNHRGSIPDDQGVSLSQISPEARVYVESAETFAANSGEVNLIEALEQQFAQVKSAAQKSRIESLQGTGNPLYDSLDPSEPLEVALLKLGELQKRAEETWGNVLVDIPIPDDVGMAYQMLIDNANSKGYTNANMLDHPRFEYAKTKFIDKDVDVVDESLPKSGTDEDLLNNSSNIPFEERVQYIKMLQSGDSAGIEAMKLALQKAYGVKNIGYRIKPSQIDETLGEGVAESYNEALSMLRKVTDTKVFEKVRSRTRKHVETVLAGKQLANSDEVTEEIYRAIIKGESEDRNISEVALQKILQGAPGDPLGTVRDLDIKLAAIDAVRDGMFHELKVRASLMKGRSLSTVQVAETLNLVDMLTQFIDTGVEISSILGRGLSARKAPPIRADLSELRAQRIIQEKGGSDAVDEFMSKILQLSETGDGAYQISSVLRKTKGRKWREAIAEFWTAGLVSGPPTQIVNIAGNTAWGLWLPTERAIGRAMSGEFKEAVFQFNAYRGLVNGFKESLVISKNFRSQLWLNLKKGDYDLVPQNAARAHRDDLGTFWKAAATGRPVTGSGMKYQHQIGAFSAKNLTPNSSLKGFPKRSGRGTTGGVMANMIKFMSVIPNASFRSLGAFDELAKTINVNMDITQKAMQAAQRQGLDAEETANFVHKARSFGWRAEQLPNGAEKDLISKFYDDAADYAEQATWTNPQAPDSTTASIVRKTNEYPELKFAIPFVNTPFNLVRAVGERTPGINRISKNSRYRKGMENAQSDPEALVAAQTRSKVGALMWATSGTLAFSGRLTGSYPRNAADRERMIQAGIPEKAFWIDVPYEDVPESMKYLFQESKDGGIWFGYGKLEPFSTFLSLSADVAHNVGDLEQADLEELTFEMTAAIADNLTGNMWMQSVNDLLSIALAEGRQDFSKVEKAIATLLVPSSVNTWRRDEDPIKRVANGLWEEMKNRLPYLSTDLLPRTDFFGKPALYPVGIGWDWMPFYGGEFDPNNVAEVMRKAELPYTQRTFYGVVDEVSLEPDEIDAFKTEVNEVTNVKGYRGMGTLIEVVEAMSKGFSDNPERFGVGKNGNGNKMLRHAFEAYKAAGFARFVKTPLGQKYKARAVQQMMLTLPQLNETPDGQRRGRKAELLSQPDDDIKTTQDILRKVMSNE